MRDVRVVTHGVDLAEWQPSAEQDAGYVLWNKTRADPIRDPQPVLDLARAMPSLPFVTTFLPEGEAAPGNVTMTGKLRYEDAKEYVRRAAVYLATTRETYGILGKHPGARLRGSGGGLRVGRAGRDYPLRRGRLAGAAGRHRRGSPRVCAGRSGTPRRGRLLDAVRSSHPALASAQQFAGDLRRGAGCGERAAHAPRVSVIVTAYALEKYLPDTLESVLAQDDPDWECVIVDDASPDRCGEIADQYAARYSRFRVIHNETNRYLAGGSERRHRGQPRPLRAAARRRRHARPQHDSDAGGLARPQPAVRHRLRRLPVRERRRPHPDPLRQRPLAGALRLAGGVPPRLDAPAAGPAHAVFLDVPAHRLGVDRRLPRASALERGLRPLAALDELRLPRPEGHRGGHADLPQPRGLDVAGGGLGGSPAADPWTRDATLIPAAAYRGPTITGDQVPFPVLDPRSARSSRWGRGTGAGSTTRWTRWTRRASGAGSASWSTTWARSCRACPRGYGSSSGATGARTSATGPSVCPRARRRWSVSTGPHAPATRPSAWPARRYSCCSTPTTTSSRTPSS